MDTTKAQQKALDDDLVAPTNHALKLTSFYKEFEITADVPEIYMQEFWVTTSRHHSSLHFKMNGKSHTVNVDNFRDMLQICPKLPVIGRLLHGKGSSIPRINKIFGTLQGMTPLFTTIKVISKHRTTQIYGVILPQHLTNQAMLESKAYKTYHAYATGEKIPKPKYVKNKADPESSPKKKSAQASKGKRLKDTTKVAKSGKKKQPAQGLETLSEIAFGSCVDEGTGVLPGVPDGNNVEGEELDEDETNEEEEVNELYRDVNVNLEGRDTEMMDALLANVQTTQVIEDTHVIITAVTPKSKSRTSRRASPLRFAENKKLVNDQLEAEVLIRSSNEAKTSHAENLYKALVDAYETDKDILETYGDTVTLKRRQDDEDEDEEPSARSNRGSKRRRAEKEPESTSAPKEKTSKTPHGHSHWISNLARKEDPRELFNELMDTPQDLLAFVLNWLKVDTLTLELLTDDDKLYTFKEGDYNRLRLQDIEDMLLLLVQGKLTNLNIEERLALGVSLRMFTRSIVIRRRVEDLQLGIERFINQNKDKKNILMHIDELHKFSDGTLTMLICSDDTSKRTREVDVDPHGFEGYLKMDIEVPGSS
ncbi:hypothetical protein Tco_0038213 [Tanacetum coccineum]